MKAVETKATIVQLISMNEDSMRVLSNENIKREMEIELFEAIKRKCERQLLVLSHQK